MLKEALLFPLYAAYGLWLVLRVGLRIARAPFAVREVLRRELKCPTCGFRNAIHDRWACSDCGAEYLGAVHTCGICGAGASWFPCGRCRAAVTVRVR